MEKQQENIRAFSLRLTDHAHGMPGTFDTREQVQRTGTSIHLFFNEASACDDVACSGRFAELALRSALELDRRLGETGVAGPGGSELEGIIRMLRNYRSKTRKFMKFGLLKDGRINLNKRR